MVRIKWNLEKVKVRVKEINPNIEILSNEYVNNSTNLECLCLVCNHPWSTTWGNLQSKHGCPKCANFIVSENNSISSISPNSLKFLKNIEDGDKYSHGSDKKILLICPTCNTERCDIKISTLVRYGFHCKMCSDGISLPEKFGINLLRALNVEFKTQYINKWSHKRKYDFYIPSLEVIIEAHGSQHYEETGKTSKFIKTLCEEQENDLLKYNLAIQNGIKSENYIVIDCRESTFDWLKENYIKELSVHFDLSNVDWLKIWEDCNETLMKSVWDAWNDKAIEDTTVTIGLKVGLNCATIRKYIKIGTTLGKCNYDGRKTMKNNGYDAGKRRSKTVYQYDEDYNLIMQWESSMEVERMLGISQGNISMCCNNKRPFANGFKWSYTLL